MKNVKFAVFCLGLTVAVGTAVAGLSAQDPSTSLGAGRVEVRRAPGRGNLMMLDGRGSQLGVTVSDLDTKAAATGVKIDDVTEDSAAAKAGLKAGDVVVEYDGERVRSARQFTRLVQETVDGRTVKIAVLRNGQKQTVEATPEARSFAWDMQIDGDRIRREVERGMGNMREFRVDPQFNYRFDNRDGRETRRFEFPTPDSGNFDMLRSRTSRGRLGVTVQELSSELADYFGASNGGALVASVTKGSAAEKAGLKAGDVITSVNGRRVDDADDLIRELEDVEKGDVSIGVIRDKKETTVKASLQ
jgi:serine protease Do